MTNEDDEALERRVRTRMAFEKAKGEFVSADAEAISVAKRLHAAIRGMTADADDYTRTSTRRRIQIGRNSPLDWLNDLPTADVLRTALNRWMTTREQMAELHKALDPADAKEVVLPKAAAADFH